MKKWMIRFSALAMFLMPVPARAAIPTVAITNPADSSTVTGLIAVSGTAFDAALASVTLSVDGGPEILASGLANWSYILDSHSIPDGNHLISAKVYSQNASTASSEIMFTVDNTTPEITISTPAFGSTVSGISMVFGSAFDANLSYVEVSFDSGTSWFLASGTTNWQYVYDSSGLADGIRNIDVRAWDSAGISSASIVSVLFDNSPPEISITGPAAGPVLPDIISIQGTASDVSLNRVEVSVDGGAPILAAGLQDWSVLFDARLWPSGSVHSLVATAIDDLNQARSTAVYVSASVTVDVTSPTLVISSPPAGSILGGMINVAGSASDANLSKVELSIDGGAWSLIPGLASWTLPLNTFLLSDGSHALAVKATDASGNADIQSVTIVSDNTQPILSIASPGPGSFVRGTVSIFGTAFDSNLSSVEISTGAVSWDAAAGLASWTYALKSTSCADGTTRVNVRAVDAAGGIKLDTVTLTIDNTLPSLAIVSPSFAAVVSGTITVSGTVSDANPIKVEINLDNGTFTDASIFGAAWNFSLDTSKLTNASHLITARATDASGNIRSSSVTVAVNNIAPDISTPTVAILSPSAGAFVRGLILVSGTAFDANLSSVSLTVDGAAAVPAAGLDSWSYLLATPGLSDGPHSVSVKAEDANAHFAVASETFTVDNTLPLVFISSPATGDIVGSTASISGTASDVNLAKIEIQIDSGSIIASTGLTDWSEPLSFVGLAKGNHNITVRAVDAAGNARSAMITVFLSISVKDTIPPTQPKSLAVAGIGINYVDLSWQSAADETLLVGYTVYRDGVEVGRSFSPRFLDVGLSPLTSYKYEVDAYDAGDNHSKRSPAITVKTKPAYITSLRILTSPTDSFQWMYVVKSNHPAFVAPTVKAQIEFPSGTKNLTFEQSVDDPEYYITFSSRNVLSSEDQALLPGTRMFVTTVFSTLTAVFDGSVLSRASGGRFAESGGRAEAVIQPGDMIGEGYLKILSIGMDSRREDALIRGNLVSLGDEREFLLTSGSLQAATLYLPFNRDLVPSGLTEKTIHLAYFNPQTETWEILKNSRIEGDRIACAVQHFSVYRPVAEIPQGEASLKDFYAYPNPATPGKNPTLHVETAYADRVDIRIYNDAGERVHEASIFQPKTTINLQSVYEYTWDVSGEADGVYVYVVTLFQAGTPKISSKGKIAFIR